MKNKLLLIWIFFICFIILGILLGMYIEKKLLIKYLKKEKELSQKHLDLFLLMTQWVKVKQNGKSIEKYLKSLGFNSIAVYGLSYVGESLIEELMNTNISVKYGIDRKASGDYFNVEVYHPDQELPKVDAVIVTSIYYMAEIEAQLSQKVDCVIVSIEDILFNM